MNKSRSKCSPYQQEKLVLYVREKLPNVVYHNLFYMKIIFHVKWKSLEILDCKMKEQLKSRYLIKSAYFDHGMQITKTKSFL